MNTYISYAFIAMILWGVSDFSMQYFVRKIGRIATLTWVGCIVRIRIAVVHSLVPPSEGKCGIDTHTFPGFFYPAGKIGIREKCFAVLVP